MKKLGIQNCEARMNLRNCTIHPRPSPLLFPGSSGVLHFHSSDSYSSHLPISLQSFTAKFIKRVVSTFSSPVTIQPHQLTKTSPVRITDDLHRAKRNGHFTVLILHDFCNRQLLFLIVPHSFVCLGDGIHILLGIYPSPIDYILGNCKLRCSFLPWPIVGHLTHVEQIRHFPSECES